MKAVMQEASGKHETEKKFMAMEIGNYCVAAHVATRATSTVECNYALEVTNVC